MHNNLFVKNAIAYYSFQYNKTIIGNELNCEVFDTISGAFPWALKKRGYKNYKSKLKYYNWDGFNFSFSDTNIVRIDSINLFNHKYYGKLWYSVKRKGELELIARNNKENKILKERIRINNENEIEFLLPK